MTTTTLLVEGINLVKKHVKPNPMKGTTGGVESKTMPLHISNVSLVDANGKASRVGIKVEDGKKVRFLKTTGATERLTLRSDKWLVCKNFTKKRSFPT